MSTWDYWQNGGLDVARLIGITLEVLKVHFKLGNGNDLYLSSRDPLRSAFHTPTDGLRRVGYVIGHQVRNISASFYKVGIMAFTSEWGPYLESYH